MMALLKVNLYIFSSYWYFYMLLNTLCQPVNQKHNLRWKQVLHVLICLAHPSQSGHQDLAHCTSLSLSLAYQLICPSSSICHNNVPYFPTPIHLAVADPDDEGTTFLQNARKYSLNDKVPLPRTIYSSTPLWESQMLRRVHVLNFGKVPPLVNRLRQNICEALVS